MKSTLLLSLLLISFHSFAQGLSRDQFDAVLDKISKIYSPIISRLNGKLEVNGRWDFPSTNPFAARIKNRYILEITGGLAKHPAMTEDAFALAVCHELGHLIGGPPYFEDPAKKLYSNEGQADYFATLKCLRLYFLKDDNEKIISKPQVPDSLRTRCHKGHKSKRDQAICIRSGLASIATANYFSVRFKIAAPNIATPDLTRVSMTSDKHPEYQCRLDTHLQGAFCKRSFREELSDADEAIGTCHALNGDKLGLRPGCWYKSIHD